MTEPESLAIVRGLGEMLVREYSSLKNAYLNEEINDTHPATDTTAVTSAQFQYITLYSYRGAFPSRVYQRASQ